MKYPKLFDGPSPGGESSIRALNRDDRSAPFLTIYGHDFVASKADDYNSVSVKRGGPYFYTYYSAIENTVDSTNYPAIVLYPELSLRTDDITDRTPKEPGTTGFLHASYMAYVGDGYVLSYYGDTALDEKNITAYWPILKRIGHLTPSYEPGDSEGKGKTTPFYGLIPVADLFFYEYFINVFPAGYKDSSSHFVFGCSWLYPTKARAIDSFYFKRGTNAQPRMFVGDTVSRTVHEVYPPLQTGREVAHFTPVCVGRGRLQYICFVYEQYIADQPFPPPTGTQLLAPKIDPSLVYSSDFGETWASVPATSLIPYLAMFGPGAGVSYPYERSFYAKDQTEVCGHFGITLYAGSEKVWYFMPAGMTTPSPDWSLGTTIYHPILFLADIGSDNFERVAWPADDWEVNIGGLPDEHVHTGKIFYEVGFRRAPSLHCAHFVFGDGCLYVPIIKFDLDSADIPVTGWEIMFTHDFGATWHYSTVAVPDAVQNVRYGCFAGAVIHPYKTNGGKGKLLFTGFDPATSQFEVWETNGNFDKWSLVYKIENAFEFGFGESIVHVLKPTYDTAFYGLNFGSSQIPSSIYPAFPGEFDHG